MNESLQFIALFKQHPMLAVGAILLVLLGTLAATYLRSYFSEKGKLHANPTSQVLSEDLATINPILAPVWKVMSPGLQNSILLAATQAITSGKKKVSTRDFFAAQVKLRPESIGDLFNLIPTEALPKPVSEDIVASPGSITKELNFSDCMSDSFQSLAGQRKQTQELSSRDVFVDIAKFGNGKSVQQLRTYDIDSEVIEKFVQQLGWTIIRRDDK